MAVMALVADVLADVVEDGGEVEPLAGPVVEAVDLARLVEDRQRQARDLLGVVGGVVAARGQLDDAAAPDVRVALDAFDVHAVAADVVENHALAQRQLAQRQLVGAELTEDRVEKDGARHDQVGAPGVEAGQPEAVPEAQRGELPPDAAGWPWRRRGGGES